MNERKLFDSLLVNDTTATGTLHFDDVCFKKTIKNILFLREEEPFLTT